MPARPYTSTAFLRRKMSQYRLYERVLAQFYDICAQGAAFYSSVGSPPSLSFSRLLVSLGKAPQVFDRTECRSSVLCCAQEQQAATIRASGQGNRHTVCQGDPSAVDYDPQVSYISTLIIMLGATMINVASGTMPFYGILATQLSESSSRDHGYQLAIAGMESGAMLL